MTKQLLFVVVVLFAAVVLMLLEALTRVPWFGIAGFLVTFPPVTLALVPTSMDHK